MAVRLDSGGMQLKNDTLDSLRACWKLSRPTRVCECRDIELDNMSCLELILKLQECGCSWQRWRAKSARPRRLELKSPTPDTYSIGDAQVWLLPCKIKTFI